MNTLIKYLDMEQLYLFRIIYKEKSVTKAAQILDIPQPTISRKLKTLRDLTNDQLFVKSNNRMEPTLYAIRLAPIIQSLIEHIEIAFKGDHDEFIPRDHEFSICLTETADHLCSAEIVNHCEAEGTNLRIIFSGCSENSSEDESRLKSSQLKSGSLDFVLLNESELYTDKSIEGVELFSSPFVVISRVHQRSRSPTDIETIDLEPFLELPFVDTDPLVVRNYLSRKSISRQLKSRTFSHRSTANIISRSRFYGLVPEVLLPKLSSEFGGFRVMRPAFDLPPMRVSLFWLRKSNGLHHNRWLKHLITHQFKKSTIDFCGQKDA